MTPATRLELAEESLKDAIDHLDSVVGHLVSAAADAPEQVAETVHHAKEIAKRLRGESNNVYALRASIGGVNLTESLERALGAEPGWAGA